MLNILNFKKEGKFLIFFKYKIRTAYDDAEQAVIKLI